MNDRLETTLSIVLVIAAVAVAGAAVDRQIQSRTIGQSANLANSVTFVDEWEELFEAGIQIGDSRADIRVVEFADLQCPFCRRFHASLSAQMASSPGKMALSFVHYPLTSHEHSVQAAVAAECAARVGRAEPFLDAVYVNQDSIGLRSWGSYAVEAGVPDTASFSRCVDENETFPRIEEGRRLAAEMGVRGTPTVIINGWRFSVPPYDVLPEVIEDLEAGREPFEGRR